MKSMFLSVLLACLVSAASSCKIVVDKGGDGVCPEVTTYGGKVPSQCNPDPCEGREMQTWYPDADHDGEGDANNPVQDCRNPDPGNYTQDGGDCDDANNGVNTRAKEICDNGIDDNCDGRQNEGCPS